MLNVAEAQAIMAIVQEVQNVSNDPQVQADVEGLVEEAKEAGDLISDLLKRAQAIQASVNAQRVQKEVEASEPKAAEKAEAPFVEELPDHAEADNL